jgi:hypothetical protein
MKILDKKSFEKKKKLCVIRKKVVIKIKIKINWIKLKIFCSEKKEENCLNFVKEKPSLKKCGIEIHV